MDRPTRRPLEGLLRQAVTFVLWLCSTVGFSQYVVNRVSVAPAAASASVGAATLDQALVLDRLSQARSVDLYYLAAVQASQSIQPWPVQSGDNGVNGAIYRDAMAGLIDAGQRYKRLDPRGHLIVFEGGVRRLIPIRYVGFAWRPDEFSRLLPAAHHTNSEIANHYASPGLGVSLIGERFASNPKETFYRPWQPFAVTAVLRPDASTGSHVLEFYNPLVCETVNWNGVPRPLARDATAPLAAIVNEVPRQYFTAFTAPNDTSVEPQLVMMEPYQRGKIPVVFIHGLASDPLTWIDMINELRVQRDLYMRFQFWTFRYPTGGEVLVSAAALRKSLLLARESIDPHHSDPALDSMVLVGHSLGGLMSKMQVTYSYDLFWSEIAYQSFSTLRAPLKVKSKLAEAFFFEPVPMVTRVIFIGTPHRGSGMATRLVGLVGSAMVSFSSEDKAQYRQLMESNPTLFKPYLKSTRPTNITLLDPESPFLVGLARMPVNRATHLHSIIGTGSQNPFSEPGDGVVAITSARHYGESEIFVPATHEMLHRHTNSINEVARILRLQAKYAP